MLLLLQYHSPGGGGVLRSWPSTPYGANFLPLSTLSTVEMLHDSALCNSRLTLTYSECSLLSVVFVCVTCCHCAVLGLVTSTVSSELFQAAQPALLYLVPFTLLPLIFMAYLKVGLSVCLSVCPACSPRAIHSVTYFWNISRSICLSSP